MKRVYILSYVNLPDDKTVHLDKEFDRSLTQLDVWVGKNYPSNTSYQIIVVKREGV